MNGWRNLIVTSDVKLKLLNNNLHLVRQDGAITLPITDIDAIIIENSSGTISIPLLCRLAELGILLIIVGRDHLPAGLFLPYDMNTSSSLLLFSQLELKEPFKKRVWQKIVRKKIENCASTLELLGKPGRQALLQIAADVRSGDTTNRESYAAKLYFKILDPNFKRFSDTPLSAALNYGYAITRSLVARSLVVTGLHCELGVGHRSKTNPFNLADDFNEVFRAFVDYLVFSNPPDGDLTTEYKSYLATVLKMECYLENKVYTVSTAAVRMAHLYAGAVKTKNPKILSLPEFREVNFRSYE